MISIKSSKTLPATAGDSGNPRIKFLTFNTWGLKWVSKHRKKRLEAIAKTLAGENVAVPLEGSEILLPEDQAAGGPQTMIDNYDVVALQEVWCKEDWEYILSKCSHIFPYTRIFYSGILTGPGLAILSKIPIESTFLYRFPINGRPSAFFRGDWYVGKSISVTLLKPLTPDTSPLAILNSHMHAPYAPSGDANYHCYRACQAWDFSKMANLYKKAGYAVVVVGDLNSKPGSLQHKLLTVETGLTDSWEQLKGKQDLSILTRVSPIEQLKIGCTTCDSTLNTWRQKCQPTDAKRLDYALIDATRLKTVNAGVRFTENIPDIGSFSDHFAYTCTLELLPVDDCQSMQTVTESLKEKFEIYMEAIESIDIYMKTAKRQKLFRGLHAIVSIALLIGATVSTTFTANKAGWSSIFWVLFAIVISITGTIDGLISFLFGRKEIRALTEVKAELTDARRAAESIIKKKKNIP
ncbi:hypothetical protein Kpol_2000p76 [Vanderwaltozyma polyspora DSM 70294]|uniref:Endonuclease/exonuclease/phosphatase domain-containing protein n=1 Tax=Vanderwaltozyma polyspora (strain ATCC 22028 / DSM 70294 / BCRC 21397 / CBS 2163 / NBRC 10782 / NRRL Y-8283 / UCD 57-17) TaxID=436907 RepID=A7TF83_VANPO|nr:uncharacterized protein Kpol_2000p76 [Vanderwaltozyma polyspora DSM 70294]EDO19108.1 hypothetical protein Kpol_2000p76 [Vanderwaltozyma polyspora DSM 70294]